MGGSSVSVPSALPPRGYETDMEPERRLVHVAEGAEAAQGLGVGARVHLGCPDLAAFVHVVGTSPTVGIAGGEREELSGDGVPRAQNGLESRS